MKSRKEDERCPNKSRSLSQVFWSYAVVFDAAQTKVLPPRPLCDSIRSGGRTRPAWRPPTPLLTSTPLTSLSIESGSVSSSQSTGALEDAPYIPFDTEDSDNETLASKSDQTLEALKRLSSWSPPHPPAADKRQRLILCMDGTRKHGFMNPSTNTYALYDALLKDEGGTSEMVQRALYVAGAGTTDWHAVADLKMHDLGLLLFPHKSWRKILAFGGLGIEKLIAHCFKEIVAQKRSTGDEIVFVGYSRGAFVGRFLAAIIGRYGVRQFQYSREEKRERPPRERGRMVDKLIRTLMYDGQPTQGDQLGQWHYPVDNADCTVNLIAAFDSVGSLYCRKSTTSRFKVNYSYVATSDPRTTFMTFRCCEIPSSVQHFIHALSLDEHRGYLAPSYAQVDMRPDSRSKKPEVCEVFFAGRHGDLGGRSSRARKAFAFMVGQLASKKFNIQFSLGTVKKHMAHPNPLKGEPYMPRHIPLPNVVFGKSRTFSPDVLNLSTAFIHHSVKYSDTEDAIWIQQRPRPAALFVQEALKQNKVFPLDPKWEAPLLDAYNTGRATNVWRREILSPTTWKNELGSFEPMARQTVKGVGKSVGGSPTRLRRLRKF